MLVSVLLLISPELSYLCCNTSESYRCGDLQRLHTSNVLQKLNSFRGFLYVFSI